MFHFFLSFLLRLWGLGGKQEKRGLREAATQLRCLINLARFLEKTAPPSKVAWILTLQIRQGFLQSFPIL